MATTWKQIDQRAGRLQKGVDDLRGFVEKENVVMSLGLISQLLDVMRLTAEGIVEWAGENTKITQREMEQALGVPKGTLRGLRRGRL